MATFAELLTEHINRAGISDAELARSVGVRRQTIFRWKEGIVERPRHRDDVLLCAQRLRLSADERDALLTAAGFAPEGQQIAPDEATEDEDLPTGKIDDQAPGANVNVSPVQPDPAKTRSWLIAALVGLLALLALLIVAVVERGAGGAATPTPLSTSPTPMAATSTPLPATPMPVTAAPDENLILVSEFANYAADQGFNVAGRLRDVLVDEIQAAELISTSVHIWPHVLTDNDAAQQVMAASDAVLLIWGEYDSGRVRVNLKTPELSADWEKLLPSPAELSATINLETPREVRSLAFLILGQLYRSRDEIVNARGAFKRVLALQPDEADTVATAKFYLATVLAADSDPDFDAAIELYDDVIVLHADWVNAHYNRGSAYLDRYYTAEGVDADLDAAIADLTWALQRRPGYVEAYLNRGIAYYERGLPGDINQALTDLDRAVALAPTERRVHFNRGLARIRRGSDDWADDFELLLTQNADDAAAHNARCWGHALAQEPELALQHCDRALELGLTRSVYDGRGIALAQFGRTDEAIADFQAYLDALSTLPDPAYERYRGPTVEQWIDELSAGDDPFDPATLEALR